MSAAERDTPRLAVIVPMYNAGDSIGKCLEAIENQRGIEPGDLEVIVVDDASTDGGADKARLPFVKLAVMEKNSGAAAARNRGVAESSAPVLVFVDSDVFLDPNALASIISRMDEDLEVAGVVGRYSEKPAARGIINEYHNAFTRYHHDLSPERIDWFWGALGAVRREAFLEVGGFDERYQGASAEDMELGLALSEAGYDLRYLPAAEGAHAHHFSLAGMLANDYKKAVLGMKLTLAGRLPRRAPSFKSAENAASIALLAACLLCIPWAPEMTVLFAPAFMGYFYLNHGLGRLLRARLRWRSIPAFGLYALGLLAICAGAAAGVLGRLLGRSPYGRPGWI